MSNAASGPSTSSTTPLPGYEFMIIDALEHLSTSEGVFPKDIFNYMMNKWPVASNFRPSAYQALQRALKRGRLIKTRSLYALAADWNEEEGIPLRTPTRRPANMHASPPANAVTINTVASSPMDAPPRQPTPSSSSSNRTQPNASERRTSPVQDHARHNPSVLAPDTKATAQAAASLLRSIAVPISDLVDDYDGQASTSTGGRRGAGGARTRSATPSSSRSLVTADGGTSASTSGFGAAAPLLIPNVPLSIPNVPFNSMGETRDSRSPGLPPRDFIAFPSSTIMPSAHDRVLPILPYDRPSPILSQHTRSPILGQRVPSFSEAGASSRSSTMLIRTRKRTNRQDNGTRPRISRPPMPSALATHQQQAISIPEMTERDIRRSILTSLEVLVAQLREARGRPPNGQS